MQRDRVRETDRRSEREKGQTYREAGCGRQGRKSVIQTERKRQRNAERQRETLRQRHRQRDRHRQKYG